MLGFVVVQHFVDCNPYGAVLRRQLVEGTAVRKV
jgi:hypothetical protein